LVGFEFEERRGTIGGIQISEGLRLVGFKFEARRGTIGGIQISEGAIQIKTNREKSTDSVSIKMTAHYMLYKNE
jgi:hypothetical protein